MACSQDVNSYELHVFVVVVVAAPAASMSTLIDTLSLHHSLFSNSVSHHHD